MNQRTFRVLVALILPISTLLLVRESASEIPDSAEVTQIMGPNSMSIRRGKTYEPVGLGGRIRHLERLDIPSADEKRKTVARLDFYNKANKPSGFAIQASVKNKLRTAYYFPCLVRSQDNLIIEWTNEKTGKRDCDKGIKVRADGKLSSDLPDDDRFAFFKQLLGQGSGKLEYCSVNGASGKGWFGIATANPCEQPLQQCKSSGEKDCTIATLDFWFAQTPKLTASVSCSNKQEFAIAGSGSEMKDKIEQIWHQAQSKGAKSCGLNVFSPEEIIIVPVVEKAKQASVVEIYPEDECAKLNLYNGSALAKSTQKPQGVLLKRGDRYRSCDDGSENLDQFDPNVESLELQIFYARQRGYQFCDTQQSAGGQAGETRTLQLTATQGELQLEYDMFQVPDRLQVIYEGKALVDTGFISGRNQLKIPFAGKSAQVKIIITGNPTESGTQWNYLLRCP